MLLSKNWHIFAIYLYCLEIKRSQINTLLFLVCFDQKSILIQHLVVNLFNIKINFLFDQKLQNSFKYLALINKL